MYQNIISLIQIASLYPELVGLDRLMDGWKSKLVLWTALRSPKIVTSLNLIYDKIKHNLDAELFVGTEIQKG